MQHIHRPRSSQPRATGTPLSFEAVTRRQIITLNVALADLSLNEEETRGFVSKFLGHRMHRLADLTKLEAERLLEHLEDINERQYRQGQR
jgi:hypothetical protein